MMKSGMAMVWPGLAAKHREQLRRASVENRLRFFIVEADKYGGRLGVLTRECGEVKFYDNRIRLSGRNRSGAEIAALFAFPSCR